MDGTLVDTEPYWIESEFSLAERYNGRWSHEQALTLVGRDLLDAGRYIREHMGIDLTPEEIVEDLLEVWPNDPVRELLVRSALWTKDYQAGLAALADERSQFSDEERKAYSATLRAMQSGNAAEKASAISLLRPLVGRDVDDARLLITALAALGADREALAEADKLIGPTGSRDQYLLFQPPFERIRRTPEFAAIVQRIGLIQYWRQSRHLPDFCRAPGAPALCRGLN